MAIVIDEDSAHLALGENDHYPILKEYIFARRELKVGLGGTLLDRYRERLGRFFEVLKVLEPGGGLIFADEARVVSAEIFIKCLVENGICVSDDTYVLALMKAGPFALICTNDQNLTNDVRNPQVLNNPRGHVYNENRRLDALDMIRNYGHYGDN